MSLALPPARQAAVDRALITTFGTSTLDSAAPLGGGLSDARVYRIRVGGIAYLLRVEGGGDPLRDPARWYGCMQSAADALLSPRVRYARAADGVAIIDHIAERSLALEHLGTRAELVTELAQAVRVLHALPAFPAGLVYLDAMDGLVGQWRSGGLFAPDLVEPHVERYRALAAAYRRLEPQPVPSHNDLNPRNILYDGTRLWLVDWESAFQADRWIDVAAIANFYCRDETEEDLLTRVYLGAPAGPETRARLFLARQINHLFYAMMLFNMAAAERPGVRVDGPWPQRSPDAGPALDTWEGRVAYGQVRLGEAHRNLTSPRFEGAVRLAA